MPTYEYKCKSCGFIFEKFQRISDEPIKKCPKCGCEVARVIYGGSGVIFKGSGWYVTDYGKGRSSASVGAKDAKPQTGETTEKPSETKSDKVKEKTIAKEE